MLKLTLKKIIYTLSLTSTLILTGCSGNNKPAEPNVSAKENLTSTTGENESNRSGYVSPLPDSAPTYSVAMMNFPPYRFKDGYGNETGYEVELLRAIGEQGGFKTTFKTEPFRNIFPSIQKGENDIAMFGLALKPERQKVMLASQPYSVIKAGFLVKGDSPLQDIDSLAGKRVATLEHSPLQLEMETQGFEVVAKPTPFLTFQTIFIDKADAVYGYSPSLIRATQKFPETPSRIIYTDIVEQTVIYTGKDKQELMIQINKALDEVMANGTYKKIYTKWFGDKASEIMIDNGKIR